MAIKTRSTITRRLAKIKGLPSDERRLLERIGTLLDAKINNRALANPVGQGRIRVDPRLPPPRNLSAQEGIKSAKISWPAVDSSILSHYELTITNTSTGEEKRFVSYTNTFFFKGEVGGEYTATVASVGRNGITSPVLERLTFTVPIDIMLLEGTKNGYNTAGIQVIEDMELLKGHKIFAWGSFTIDSVIAGSGTGNPTVSLNLYRGDKDTFLPAEATLLETIPIYKASESATCLANTALGGITRPALSGSAATDTAFERGTTFETSFSVMFAPFEVPDDEVGNLSNFILEATGREDANDVISLSLTLWSAAEGEAEFIPATPVIIEPAYVYPWFRSISLNEDMNGGIAGLTNTLPATQGKDFLHRGFTDPPQNSGAIPASRQLFSDHFSFSCWIKFRRWSYYLYPGPLTSNSVFATHSIFQPPISGRWGAQSSAGSSGGTNSLILAVSRQEDFSDQIVTRISVGGADDDSDGLPDTGGFIEFQDAYTNADGSEFTDPTFSGINPVWIDGLNEWHFVTITFEPSVGVRLYVNGGEKTGPASNTTTTVTPDNVPVHPRIFVFGCDRAANMYTTSPTGVITRFVGLANIKAGNLFPRSCADCIIYAAGLWNTTLDIFDHAALYNSGDGASAGKNWRNNFDDYNRAANLVHYWQMGAEISDFKWVARDTGYFLPESGGVSGRASASDEDQRSPIMTLDRNIVQDFPT